MVIHGNFIVIEWLLKLQHQLRVVSFQQVRRPDLEDGTMQLCGYVAILNFVTKYIIKGSVLEWRCGRDFLQKHEGGTEHV